MLDANLSEADLPGLAQAVLGQAVPLAALSLRLQAAAAASDPQKLVPLAFETARLTAGLADLTRQLQALLKPG